MTATSRTYLSALERGRQSPTLDKLESIADDIGVHPLTLLIYAYSADLSDQAVAVAKSRIQRELEELARYDVSSL
ncbi:helix-turn-helix domain-containing protein [Paraburkholderia sp. BR13444]|uniref:helix-turn-helix domain-containing protein n=1 Tax=Paraburkholderia sp. BR13444 TaxID=3236997 RepID=UPI0034CD96C0